MRIVITGAAGRIGRVMFDELAACHELILVDRQPRRAAVTRMLTRGTPYVRADLADSRWSGGEAQFAWERAFVGADAILHLAGDPSPQATPASALRNNVVATRNLIDVAVRQSIQTVVFASSHWTHTKRTQRAEAEWGRGNRRLIDPAGHACPNTSYGLSKAAAENLGCAAVAAGRLKGFVAVRIGAVGWRPCSIPRTWASHHLQVGVADLRMILRLCLERSICGFHVVGAASPGPAVAVDLSNTWRLLGWSPPEVHATRSVA